MNKIFQNPEKLVHRMSIIITFVSFIVVFGFIGYQAYVRWVINQTFMTLGGSELEVFTVSTFALLIALLYIYRPVKVVIEPTTTIIETVKEVTKPTKTATETTKKVTA